ncbi:MAG: glutathione S-transferase N-terminal domain-containing protein [Betaproteobacteria bacterium]|nr:glutathione S-transferase N-terminal domain-containing protein [Betaproteobacteria bacterium]MDE2423507.1 glutathione S-transferase N-terminal domain-containing protein [Betaproteobacteria bacterium]
MKLYGSITSPYVRKVRITLIEKKIDFTLEQGYLNGTPPMIDGVNPLGKVPALELDDGTLIYDSAVIVDYLEGLNPVGHLIPDDRHQRMLVKRWESLADGMLDAAILVLLETRREKPEERSQAWIDKHQGKVDRTMAFLSHQLAESNWCQGDSFTLADIAVGSALLWIEFRFPNNDWRQRYPNLDRLVTKLMQRKSFQETPPQG